MTTAPGNDNLAELERQFGKAAVGPDGKLSWDLSGKFGPQPRAPEPAPVMSAGGGGTTWHPPVAAPPRRPPESLPRAVVPLLAALLAVESLHLVLALLRALVPAAR